jgi:hypothetical protein
MKEKNLKAKIKEMEAKKREETAPVVEAEVEVTFDSWFHQRKHMIPKCHMKEILMADFQARGLKLKATMAAYDKALELYGVKLK